MKNKNVGPFLAFSPAWFNKHQASLLWLLNNSFTKRWFRWVLRIRKGDISIQEKITKIAPNHFSFGDRYFKKGKKWYIERKTDFRTHVKFAKRLYFAFKPMWWVLHYLDLVLLDKFLPEYSFGFLTLTAYPDPDPETTTVDGFVNRATAAGGEDWATIIAGAGTSNVANGGSITYIYTQAHGSTSGNWTNHRRSIFLFDTSALGASASISAAVLSLFGNAKTCGTHAPTLDIYTSTPASNTALANGDYSQLGSVSQTGSAMTCAAYSTSAYNAFTFDATGIGNVSKTGVSKFGLRNANYDVAATTPTWAAGTYFDISGYDADAAGTTNDPKLVVTYTAPTTYEETYSEVVAVTDTLFKSTSRLISEVIAVVDTFIGSIIHAKVLSEVITVTDSIARSVTKLLTETVTVVDTVIKSIERTISEAVTIVDSVVKNITKVLTEQITITDTLKKLLNGIQEIWNNQIKNSSSHSNQAKNSSSYSNKAKNTADWTNQEEL